MGRARGRSTGGWWAAGAVLAAFVVVARTGTVDAPSQASEAPLAAQRSISSDSMIALETHVLALETALEVLQGELRTERDRATALETDYRTLEAQIDDVTLSTSGRVEASARQGRDAVRPAEATFVRPDQDR
ncbi:MAG: hypothetical protein AAGB93_22645 [Planctomycetota bacterium]